MYIHKVISYKKAWPLSLKNNREELSEALQALDKLISHIAGYTPNEENLSPRDFWEESLISQGWDSAERYSKGKRIVNSRIGPVSNGFSAAIPIGIFDQFGRWLFQDSAIAIKHEVITLPVLFVPTRDHVKANAERGLSRETFENYQRQIEQLSPVSIQYPFLVVGYSSEQPLLEPECYEVESDGAIDNFNSVVDRCIEFPAEYHQAGLGILNYFGTYLREQYPDEDASVKIEQHGLTVRLIIVTKDGRSEVVEKALHEYELIISGAASPAAFTNNADLVLDLRNELRVAQYRLESKQDIIGMQNAQISKLFDIVSLGLSNPSAVSIDFKPVITLTNDVKLEVNLDVVGARDSIKFLLDEIPRSNQAHTALLELEHSLVDIEKEVDKSVVKRSTAMKRFKEFVDKVVDDGSEFNEAIKKADSGWQIFSDIAKKYNGVAEWCGLPVVPSALLK